MEKLNVSEEFLAVAESVTEILEISDLDHYEILAALDWVSFQLNLSLSQKLRADDGETLN